MNGRTKQSKDIKQTRIKTQPKFEIGEPNISFYAELEKKTSKKRTISELLSTTGEMKHESEDIKEIAVDFYTDLFSEKSTKVQSTDKLLKNIENKLTSDQKLNMDAIITEEELRKTVKKLRVGKSPGPDGCRWSSTSTS